MRFHLCTLALISAIIIAPQNSAAQPEVKFSGFILLNAQYNDANAANPDIVTAALGGEDGSLIITPRQSRFAVSINSKDARWKPSAKIEMDFWGLHTGTGAIGVTQPAPRLRAAYFDLQLDAGVKLLFGQNWIVFAPLNPTTLAHQSIPANTTAGNLWARLPMLRLDVKSSQMDFSFSVNRPHSGDAASVGIGPADVVASGEHSQLPIVQTRLAAHAGKSVVGVAAHWGQLDYQRVNQDKTNSQAVAADFNLALGKLAFLGEYFLAQNVGMLFSNIKALPAFPQIRDVKGQGGWAQVSLEASSQVTFNACFGAENYNLNDASNTQWFGNVMFKPDKPLAFALEVGHTRTKNAASKFKNLGFNLGCQYSF